MLQLLDTTLRDGSYTIDFQFTAEDTAVIAAALDAQGVHYIEVGHGVGLGASRNPNVAAAESDARYCAAASRAVRRNRWGMFCIPGIASLEDLERAADCGMHFVRVGTNVTETEQAAPFIARARALGLQVFANFMKTYAMDPAGVAERAARVVDDGAQVVCVVDSAGGMLPEDVERYVTAITSTVPVAVGFHGHDNLGMAVANTLSAVAHGATVVDTSLRGMGRSAGNAATEATLFALLRRGHDLGIDPVALLTLAEQQIDPLLDRSVRDRSIGVVAGYAQFHSSFMSVVDAVATERQVDRRDLIIAVTRADKIEAPRALVEAAADTLRATGPVRRRLEVGIAPPESPADGTLEERVRALAHRVHSAARRSGLRSVLNITQSLRGLMAPAISQSIHAGRVATVATVEVASADDALRVAQAVDGLVDDLLLDVDDKRPDSGHLRRTVGATRSGVLPYSDLGAWTTAVLDVVTAMPAAAPATDNQIVVLGGEGDTLTSAMLSAARTRRLDVRLATRWEDVPRDATTLIVCAVLPPRDRPPRHDAVPRLVIDAWIGALSPEQLGSLQVAGAMVLRPDMRAVLQAEIDRAITNRQLLAGSRGVQEVDGIPVAAGGVLAPRGTIVVDSVDAPRAVHGVADGCGMLLPAGALDAESAERLQRARTRLLHSVG